MIPPIDPERNAKAVRIGFLFNHDQIHQIAHSLPIAIALAEYGEHDIVIATTNSALRAEIARRIGGRAPRVTFAELDTSSFASRILERALGKLVPARKILIYRDNLEFFRSLDLLVVSERTSLLLKTRYGLKRPLMILADHGAGDRAIGFNTATAQFDLILAAGSKIRNRLVRDVGVAPDRIAVTGYPKLDAFSEAEVHLPIQDNRRTTVLYNPHPSPHLSSWYAMGEAVLDFFRGNDDYNLIFAPHVMLFQRRFTVTIDKPRIARIRRVAPRFQSASNILVDTGSVASTDMTYTRAADLYLGDVSSQVYEFLARPRPCVFLNPQRLAWRGDPNFAHWQAGPVVECIEELGPALDAAIRDHDAVYRPIQQRLFDYTFSRDEQPASVRAARAIAAFARDFTALPPSPRSR